MNTKVQVQSKSPIRTVSPAIADRIPLHRPLSQIETDETRYKLQLKDTNFKHDFSSVPVSASSQIVATPFSPHSSDLIQAKLRFGKPGGKYEQEADRVAETMMRISEPEVQRLPAEEKEAVKDEAKFGEISRLIQRQEDAETSEEEETEEEKEEEEKEEIVQSSSGAEVSFKNGASNIAEVIRAPSHGSPMNPEIRRTLESYMGVDLNAVRVHDDNFANQASAGLRARAFTHKNHIWLGPGESQADLRLMSHETTHVLQQGGVARRKSFATRADEDLVQTLPNRESGQVTALEEPRPQSRAPSSRSLEERPTIPAETRTEMAEARTETAPGEAAPVAALEQAPRERAEERGAREAAPVAAVPETAAPEPAGIAPEDQERHRAVIERLEEAAAQQEGPAASSDRQRQASEQGAEEASDAAPTPDNEAQSRGQAAQIETMNSQEAGEVNRESFLEIVRRRLRELVPSTPNDLDEFRERGGASGLREGLRQTASQQAEGAQSAIRSATETEPSPGEARAPESLPEQTGPGQAPELHAQEALPVPREDAEISLEENRQEVESRLSEEDLTEERLRRANDPRFTAVQEAREAVHEHADTAPQQYREEEQRLLNEQEGAIAREETIAAGEMEQSRQQSQQQIRAEQQTAMTAEEARRRAVSDHIEGIYTRTREGVEGRLDGLNREVESRFTEGERRARERFEEFIDSEMTAWKLRRYGSRALVPFVGVLIAAGTWVYDKLRDINEFPEVRQIYEDGKNQYISDLDTVIVDISDLVESTLAQCQDQIRQSRDEIQEYVDGLPESLREVGEQTSSRISERYDELRNSVEERRNTLADQLVERYQQARQGLDQRISEMQAENRGLVNRFVEGLREVLEAIRNFRERLMSILGEARDVIELILEDPIAFLGHLVEALRMGFRQFGANIWDHLRRGLMGWLFGTLASAGVTIPSEFSVRAVVGLILQVLGITYDRIRTKVARIIGERNVAMLERVWEYVSTLIREGPIGLWEQIREELGDLKDMVIEGIKQWVVTRIITAAITRLVSMFNPVGAIVQAVMAIYNTVMFFIERINQIMELVQGIVRSLGAIVRGQLSAAANRVEQVMGLAVPVIISFLARLLGLGGIAGTISNMIGRVRSRVDRAIDRALRGIVRRIRGLVGRRQPTGIRGETTSTSDGTDIESRARQMLISQLGTVEHTRDEVQSIARSVAIQLRPQGVRRLEVGPADERGEYEILIEASPLRPFLSMVPMFRRARMRSVARVTLRAGPPITWSSMSGLGDPGRRLNPATGLMEEIEPASRIVIPEQIGHPRTTIGAAAIMTEPGRRVHVVSRATGDYTVGAGTSHSERYIVDWIDNQSWRDQINEIEIQNFNLNPCQYCGGQLIYLLNRLKREGHPIQAKLTWSKPWGEEDLAVIENTISNMKRAGWTVIPDTVNRADYAQAYSKAVARASGRSRRR